MTRRFPIVLVLAALAVTAFAAAPPTVMDIYLKLSPDALVLGGPGVWVTAHTDIAFSSVDGTSVALEGVEAVSVFADNRGQLVAKFRQADIEAIVSPPDATLTLTGLTVDGVRFAGTDTIRVMESKQK